MKTKQELQLNLVVSLIAVFAIVVWVVIAHIPEVKIERRVIDVESLSEQAVETLDLTLNHVYVEQIEPQRSMLSPRAERDVFTSEELDAVATTLAGECYDNQLDDKRDVAWVICNRVADGRFGDSIIDVIVSPNQFAGYWKQGRKVSVSDYEIASEVLSSYFAGEEPRHNYLHFNGGVGKTNIFR